MNQALSNALNFCTTSGLLTATGTVTTYDTTVTIEYAIGGKAYQKTAITTGTTPTTDAVTGAALTLTGTATSGEGCSVIWCLDKDGNVKCMFGAKVAVDRNGAFARQPEFPTNIPATLTPFAYQVCKHYGQASVFTFGGSNWDTSGFSGTPVNVFTLPDRPQAS